MEKVLLCILLGILLFLGMLIRFILKFNKKTRIINKKILFANSWQEFVRYKQELHLLYWCFIPGLTPERVKTIGIFLKYVKTKKEKQEKDDGLMKMLFPSLASIFICMLCLMGGTYAWFTATISTPTLNIESAHYNVESTVVLKDSTENNLPLSDGTYQLESGKIYTVTLKATGNASTGYCVFELTKEKSKGIEKWYTQQFPSNIYSGDEISFEIKALENITVKFTPQWGTCSNQEGVILNGTPYECGTAQAPTENNTTPSDTDSPVQDEIDSAETIESYTNPTEEPEQTIQEEIKEAE